MKEVKLKLKLIENMSPQEQLSRLISGEYLYTSDLGHIYLYLDDNGVFRVHKDEECDPDYNDSASSYKVSLSKPVNLYIEVEPEWYECIPSCGVLVYTDGHIAVLNNYNESQRTLENTYNGDTFNVDFLTPLTNEEVRELMQPEAKPERWEDGLSKGVECYVSDHPEYLLNTAQADIICSKVCGDNLPYKGLKEEWKYAIPVDKALRNKGEGA